MKTKILDSEGIDTKASRQKQFSQYIFAQLADTHNYGLITTTY